MWNIEQVSPTLQPFAKRIEAALSAVRSRIAALHAPQPVTFRLIDNKPRTIRQYGLGGYCDSANAIQLFFDPQNPNMEPHLDETLERTIAHEYHHALRWAGPGYGTQLGAALVTEGLAGHFVRQLYNSQPEPWEVNLSEDDLIFWRKKAYADFDTQGYDHVKWFFGASGTPQWIGYTLGYDLIKRHLSANPDDTAFGLAQSPYTGFRGALDMPK